MQSDLPKSRTKIGHGLLPDKIKPEDYVFGGFQIPTNVLQPDGQWDDFLPEIEFQKRNHFESMNCFPYFSKVLMEDLTLKRISEIKKGDYIISHLGKKQKVLKTFKRKYNGEFVEIKIKGLFNPIICTSQHPILTKRGWIKAEDITKEDVVYIPLLSNYYKDATIQEIEKNPDFLWFLGFYLAEGSLGKEWKGKEKDNNKKLKVRGSGNGNGSITFSISKKEIDTYGKKIIKIGEKLFDTKFHVYTRPNSESVIVVGYNTYLRNLIKELGSEYCSKKELNPRMMLLKPELQINILRGWLDGDGYISKEKRRVQGVTTSLKLARQMYQICLRNKIKSTLNLQYCADGRKQAYSVNIYGIEINKIYRLDIEDTDPVNRRDKIIEGFLLRSISSIDKKSLKNIGIVYNIEVENDNSYIVNNIAVHNCTSYGTLNCLETLLKRVYSEEKNFSERYVGVVTGTDYWGNSPHKVIEGIRKEYGLIKEELLPFDETIDTWDKYYSPKPMTEKYLEKGREWLKRHKIRHEWVFTSLTLDKKEKLKEALKYSPIGVSVIISQQNNKGYYIKLKGEEDNHWVMLYGYKDGEYWKIFDHYNNTFKKIDWNYDFSFAKRYYIEKSEEEIKRSCLIKLKDIIKWYINELLK